MISIEEFEAELVKRQTQPIRDNIKNGCVAIAGLGGLGSNIAVMLARTGIKKLLLVDYDSVELSNINRQAYELSHIGLKKTEALTQIIHKINPFIELETKSVLVTEHNVVELFADYPILCEAFDSPEAKAMLINTALQNLSSIKIVSGSGMAGFASSNLIQTRQRFSRLYLCGDTINEVTPYTSLTAARVSICAGHQANMIIRLLLGYTNVEETPIKKERIRENEQRYFTDWK